LTPQAIQRQLPYQGANSGRLFGQSAFSFAVLSKRCGISAGLWFLAEFSGQMHKQSIADEAMLQLVKSPV